MKNSASAYLIFVVRLDNIYMNLALEIAEKTTL